MIRQFIRDTIADLTNAVARSELTAENARLSSRVKDLERTVNQNVEAGNALMWERDDARRERDDLRAKLEAAERDRDMWHQSSDDYDKLRDEVQGQLETSQNEADYLREKLEAAERRGPVDRERAIEAVLAKLAFMSRDEACEAVDAVLGSARTGSEKPRNTWHCRECGTAGTRCESKLGNARCEMIDGHAFCHHGHGSTWSDSAASTPAFTPAPTGEYASPEVLARIRTLISASSSPTDAAPRIYALIAGDHAAVVKRVGELEAENRRLVGELNQAKADRDTAARLSERDSAEVARLSAPCPADGMSDAAVGEEIENARNARGASATRYARMGIKARSVFGRPAR